MVEDFERCYRALRSRDARFDGWFYTAVTSTRVYCRPSCPARTPKPENVRFYPTAAAAQRAGFRACKRCRPDASPGSPEWNTRADVVARAMRLVSDGVVDREGVPGLARRLGYSARQLERLLSAEVGAGPLALARAQRAQSARLLIETTDLPLSEVAFGAGFSSIRQFNDTVRSVFAVAPGVLRETARRRADPGRAPAGSGVVSLRLPFRQPLAPEGLFAHLGRGAVPGCEEERDGWFRRGLSLSQGPAVVALRPAPEHVECRLALEDLRDLAPAIARCRRLLDLDADPVAVGEGLGGDPALAEVVAKTPGRRVPGTADPGEMALRAVLGQQVSTRAAGTAAGRLAARLGTPLADPAGGLGRLFPTPAQLAAADPAGLGLPVARARTVVALARALAEAEVRLGPGDDRQAARAALAAIPGIGPWTVEVIAMRALGDPDAFPASDLGVARGAAALGLPAGPRALAERARGWAPWRSYAVQYLWNAPWKEPA